MMLNQQFKKWLGGLTIIILLAFFVIQVVFSMMEDSAIEDEPPHISSGYALLKTGDARMNPEHPYLIKILAALPLLFQNINLDLSYESWQKSDEWKFGDDFLYRMGNNADQILFSSRLVMVFLGVVLGIVVWRFAKFLYGQKAGIFALFLYCFSPLFLAHTRYITTDVGVTLFFILTVFMLFKYFRSGSAKWLVFGALFLGLANLSKFSALILIPMSFLIFLIFYIWSKRNKQNIITRPILSFIWFLLAGLFILWVGYGLPIAPDPGVWRFFNWQNFTGSSIEAIFENLIPSSFWRGLIDVIVPTMGGRKSYALGVFQNGFWYYFILAFFIKVQLSLIISLFFAIFCWIKKIIRFGINEFILSLLVIFYFLISSFQKLDIGIRHILPIFPLIFLLVSPMINFLKLRKFSVIFMLILVIWYALAPITSFPGHLQYFNEIIGGAKNSHHFLIDSNIDWGQDLKRLKKYLIDRNINILVLDYFGGGDPDYEGLQYIKLTDEQESFKGIIAISISRLLWERNDGKLLWLNPNQPSDRIGNSIFIYYRN